MARTHCRCMRLQNDVRAIELRAQLLHFRIVVLQTLADDEGELKKKFVAQTRLAFEQAEEIRAKQAENLRSLFCQRRGRARRLVQQREFAEEFAVLQHGEHLALFLRKVFADGDFAVLNDVHAHARFALPKNGFAHFELAAMNELFKFAQFGVGHVAEERHLF